MAAAGTDERILIFASAHGNGFFYGNYGELVELFGEIPPFAHTWEIGLSHLLFMYHVEASTREFLWIFLSILVVFAAGWIGISGQARIQWASLCYGFSRLGKTFFVQASGVWNGKQCHDWSSCLVIGMGFLGP